MKFYFSGTGNSLYVAKQIGDKSEEVISIAKLIDEDKEVYEFELKDKENIAFIFPIYAWAPPKMVIDFINKIRFKNYNDNYIFFVATCGENVGNTVKLMRMLLEKKLMKLNSGFSISMPNNYVIVGDVDSDEEVNKRLENTKVRINKINNIISKKEDNIFDVVKGPLPSILTTVVNPLFQRTAINTEKFYANDKCIGCKICEKVCNSNTIKVDKKPQWGKKCAGCLACLHLCPAKAINYGKGTEKKGRYVNPLIDKREMNLR